MTPCCAEVLGYLSKQLLLSAIGEFYTCDEDYQIFVKTSTCSMYTGIDSSYFHIYFSLLIEFILGNKKGSR